MNKEESDILNKLRNNDKDSLGKLFFFYYKPLLIFANKFVNEDNAKDIIQDCFLDLWHNRNKIKITTSIQAYLFTIVKNRCYKYLKENLQKAGKSANVNLQLKQKELLYYINSEKSILEFDVKDRIEKVINHLPEKCCIIFKESRFNGQSNKEIARKYGISIKAVEKQITKALKLFREEFRDILILLISFLIPKL